MKKTKLFIISAVVLITLISVSSLYAVAKPDTAVYGVYGETYSGANIRDYGDASSDENTVNISLWEGTISCANNSEFSEKPEFLLKDHDYSETSYSDYNGYNNTIIEGDGYLRFLYGTAGWIGAAFTRANGGTIDMSNYAGGTIKFSARSMSSSSGTVKNTKILFQTKSLGDNLLGTLDAITSDWKEFEFNIPNNVDLSDVTSLFVIFQNQNVHNGDDIDIDNIRWVKSGVVEMDVKDVSFEAELKNGSEITWEQNVFRTGWKISNQYIDLKCKLSSGTGAGYTAYVSTSVAISNASLAELAKWKVKIYTSKSTATKDGLLPYNNGEYYASANPLPLCWRISNIELTDFRIEEIPDQDGYRHLQNPAGLYCYFYLKNEGSEGYSVKDDYSTIWSSKGCHVSEDPKYGFDNTGFTVLPKLYIGADFTNAAGSPDGSFKYESVIVIEYHYDQ